ncbi:MAG: helix-turn-helix domain-containing protein [Lachnospiraceae bacterium]|nr:helix-turn-helix domain-containing protein [Lachnospiraceae bacterium]
MFKTQGERVKEIRKELGLTLKLFGERIGMRNNSISQIENGVNSLTDTTAKLICKEFNVNEDWLLHGKEPKYKVTANMSLDDYAKSKGATDLDLKIIKLYLELDPDIRKNLVEHFRNGLKEVPNRIEPFNTDGCLTASNDEGTSEVPSIAASSDETISEEQFWEEVEPAEEKTTG